MNKIFMGLIALALLFVLLGAYIAWNSQDIPPPDTNDLTLVRAVVPAEKNAYTFFSNAMARIEWPEDDQPIIDMLNEKSWDNVEAQDLLQKNAEALSLVDKGLTLEICRMPEVPTNDTKIPYIAILRRTGRLLALRAAFQRRNEQLDSAADSCRKTVTFGSTVMGNAECMIGYLVGQAVTHMGLHQCLCLARVPSATSDQLKELARSVHVATAAKRGLIRAMKSEYHVFANAVDDFPLGDIDLEEITGEDDERTKVSMKLTWYAWHPNRSKLIHATLCRDTIANADNVSADKDIPQRDTTRRRWPYFIKRNAVGRVLINMLAPASAALLEKGRGVQCQASAAQLVLLCNAYRKQKGDYPASLEQLRPNYLAQVPLDPFDGQPFRYSKQKRIVYSVGKDLKDSGGSKGPAARPASWRWWHGDDFVFELDKTGE